MFEHSNARSRSMTALTFSFLEVTYHATVRKVRKSHGNAVLSIALSVLQSVVFIAAFYLMFTILGGRTAAIRGNYMLYLMSGIFLYLVHIQTLRAVMTAENSTSAMMQHAPMNTLVSIVAEAMQVFYVKTVSMFVMLLIIHVMIEPVTFYNWEGAFRMYMLAWGSGVAFGVIFMALTPWAPDAMQLISMIYIRANMIFSGKMFVANSLPAIMLPVFSWNPLFHIIDQTRGHVFVNYVPHVTSAAYPFYFTLVALLLGFMLEHQTRKYASASWSAKR